MSITKLKLLGKWALPINNTTTNNAGRALAGRVIVGMLTGNEEPDPSDPTASAKPEDPKRR